MGDEEIGRFLSSSDFGYMAFFRPDKFLTYPAFFITAESMEKLFLFVVSVLRK